MKIYLAGPCDSEHRTLMTKIADTLEYYSNEEVYRPWTLKIENAWNYNQCEWAHKVFDADLKALDECDCAVLISFGRVSSAGTNWENGYLYAKNKPVYVVQITKDPTSLMTFCGCKHFWGLNKEDDIWNTIGHIGRIIGEVKDCPTIEICKTTLT